MGFSRAAAPSKPGFGLLERKAAKRAKKILCRDYGVQFLSYFAHAPIRLRIPRHAKNARVGGPGCSPSAWVICGRAYGAWSLKIDRFCASIPTPQARRRNKCLGAR